MMDEWQQQEVLFKYMLSDFTLYRRKLVLKVRLSEIISKYDYPTAISSPNTGLSEKEEGYLMRSFPLPSREPVYRTDEEYIYYIPDQFSRYYIDLQQSFEEYIAKFSSKTRSTIKRKIKRFSSKCDGDMRWNSYRTVDELNDFYRGARIVSSKSYQEKLLDSGLPNTKQFRKTMANLAKEDLVRGYLLFDGDRPVAYMYCPIKDKVLLYKYLGYDSEYIRWSVGTILHWFSFQDIFGECIFKYFDFTEGQSEHKRLYSTGSLLCGNVYIFPKNISAWFLVRSHHAMNVLSHVLGRFFDKVGLKSKLIRFIRFNLGR